MRGMKPEKRHAIAYRFGRVLLEPVFRFFLHYQAEPVPVLPFPYVVIPNHTTDLDFLLPFKPFKTPLYFVAGENLFRSKPLRLLIEYFFDPIKKQKGDTDVRAVVTMLRRIRQGSSICLFAEGNTTFDGITGGFPASTGTFVRTSGAGLVTYRFEGGYLTFPRWAHSIRRGHITGRLARIYTPGELAGMTPEEINAAITRDISYDAYAAQEKTPAAFRGRKMAEGLENVLYMCPSCRGIGTISGQGNQLSCACGMSAAYTEYGLLSGAAPFRNVRDWAKWQRKRLEEQVRESEGEALLRDEEQTLCLQMPDHSLQPVDNGTLEMSREELRLGGTHFPLSKITGLALYRKNTLLFTDAAGSHYQVLSGRKRSGLKYRDLYEIIKEKKD